MNKKLGILGIFCVISLFAFVQAPRIVLSRGMDERMSRFSQAASDQQHGVNALAFGTGGNDFAITQQQVEPTPTPTTGTSPLPTPTTTPIPAPTSLPPTGADLTQMTVSANGWHEPRLTGYGLTDQEQAISGQSAASYLATGSLVYPVRLAAAAIGLDTSVKPLGWRQVTEGNQDISIWHMVDKNAGWHLNSVVPGQVGNAVISGHNNINGAVFRNLHRLQPGDEITVWTNEGTAVAYRVKEVNIVPETYASAAQQAANAQAIGATSDERLTLVTCWPANSNTHRVIVVAHPVE